jgi:hypothetical protein
MAEVHPMQARGPFLPVFEMLSNMLPVEQRACKDGKSIAILTEMPQRNGKLKFAAVTRASP